MKERYVRRRPDATVMKRIGFFRHYLNNGGLMMKRCALSIVASLCLIALLSCQAADPKAGLVQATKGADLKGYTFASYEDGTVKTASFTNGGVRDGITLKNDGTVVLKYETIEDKKKNSVTTRRTDMVRNGRSLNFLITDLGTNQVLDRQSVSIPNDDGGTGGGGGTGNLPLCSDARRDYECRQQPFLQCEANRTCRIQRGGYSCCETPGQNCMVVDTIVVPNTPRCLFRYVAVDRLILRSAS
jgi:hypothetical protein